MWRDELDHEENAILSNFEQKHRHGYLTLPEARLAPLILTLVRLLDEHDTTAKLSPRLVKSLKVYRKMLIEISRLNPEQTLGLAKKMGLLSDDL